MITTENLENRAKTKERKSEERSKKEKKRRKKERANNKKIFEAEKGIKKRKS